MINKKNSIRFLHIPKTAGTTFKAILKRNYPSSKFKYFEFIGDEKAKCLNKLKDEVTYDRLLKSDKNYFNDNMLFLGHSPIKSCVPEANNLLTITFLRKPVDRILSFVQHKYGEEILKNKNEIFFSKKYYTETIPSKIYKARRIENLCKYLDFELSYDKSATKEILNKYCITSKQLGFFCIQNKITDEHVKIIFLSKCLEKHQNEISNLQIKMLINSKDSNCAKEINKLKNRAPELAYKNLLEKIDFYGIQERFNESVLMMKEKYKWSDVYYIKENKSQQKEMLNFKNREMSKVFSNIKNYIKECNHYDEKLYKLASENLHLKIKNSKSLNEELNNYEGKLNDKAIKLEFCIRECITEAYHIFAKFKKRIDCYRSN